MIIIPAELRHLDPANVREFLPRVEYYKRRHYTAAACANAIVGPWSKQASADAAMRLRPAALIWQDLTKACAMLGDVIHFVYGTRVLFTNHGEVMT